MKILLGALGAALAIVLGLLGWMGALSPVAVAERDMGPYQFVYVQEASSEHAKVDELTDALAQRLDAAGVTARKPAQEYYPVSRGIQNQVGFMVDQTVQPDALGAEAFQRPIAVQRYMVVEFPYRNHLSFAIARLRIEPALRRYGGARKYVETSSMVIQDGASILYLSPIGTS